jgi:hypothetical protein
MRSTTGTVPACGNGSIRCRQLFWIAALHLADVQFDEERLAAIDTLLTLATVSYPANNLVGLISQNDTSPSVTTDRFIPAKL